MQLFEGSGAFFMQRVYNLKIDLTLFKKQILFSGNWCFFLFEMSLYLKSYAFRMHFLPVFAVFLNMWSYWLYSYLIWWPPPQELESALGGGGGDHIYIYIYIYIIMPYAHLPPNDHQNTHTLWNKHILHTYVCMYVCMHACMDVCMYVCMYVNDYTYTNISQSQTSQSWGSHFPNSSHVLPFWNVLDSFDGVKVGIKGGGARKLHHNLRRLAAANPPHWCLSLQLLNIFQAFSCYTTIKPYKFEASPIYIHFWDKHAGNHQRIYHLH